MSSVNILSLTPGTHSSSLGKAVDAAAGAADVGVAMLAVRDDVLSALTPADGDYARLRVNSQGALHTVSAASSAVGSEANLFDAESVSSAATSSSTVDITGCSNVTVLVSGSATAATSAYDIHLSADGGTTFYYSRGIFPVASDGAGNSLPARYGMMSLAVHGCNALKLVAHDTETVTATVVGQ